MPSLFLHRWKNGKIERNLYKCERKNIIFSSCITNDYDTPFRDPRESMRIPPIAIPLRRECDTSLLSFALQALFARRTLRREIEETRRWTRGGRHISVARSVQRFDQEEQTERDSILRGALVSVGWTVVAVIPRTRVCIISYKFIY